jgi:hypothetical protein
VGQATPNATKSIANANSLCPRWCPATQGPPWDMTAAPPYCTLLHIPDHPRRRSASDRLPTFASSTFPMGSCERWERARRRRGRYEHHPSHAPFFLTVLCRVRILDKTSESTHGAVLDLNPLPTLTTRASPSTMCSVASTSRCASGLLAAPRAGAVRRVSASSPARAQIRQQPLKSLVPSQSQQPHPQQRSGARWKGAGVLRATFTPSARRELDWSEGTEGFDEVIEASRESLVVACWSAKWLVDFVVHSKMTHTALME